MGKQNGENNSFIPIPVEEDCVKSSKAEEQKFMFYTSKSVTFVEENNGLIPDDYNLRSQANIEIFGTNLRAARLEYSKRFPSEYPKRLSLKELATKVKVSDATLCYCENKKIKTIPVDIVQRLAIALKITVHYLLGLVSDMAGVIETEKVIIRDDIFVVRRSVEQKTYIAPFSFYDKHQVLELRQFQGLHVSDPSLYRLIVKIIKSSEAEQALYKKVLRTLIDELSNLTKSVSTDGA